MQFLFDLMFVRTRQNGFLTVSLASVLNSISGGRETVLTRNSNG